MTVAENVFVMRKGFKKYVISKPVLISQFAALAAEYGVDVDGGVYVRDLSLADRYIIQALKAATSGCALVIIRNTGLQYGGAELTLFQQQVRRFAERGVSFIYISGDINVLTGACDRIAVAEGGRVIRVVDRSEFTSKKLSRYHYLPDSLLPSPGTDLVSVLRFDKVRAGMISMLDFSVSKWECVLLWDRTDRIRYEMRRLLTREIRPASGEIRILGSPFTRARVNVRISYIREAPTRSMIFSEMNYLDNLCIRAAERIPSLWLKNSGRKIIRDEYRGLVGDDIDADSPAELSAESLYSLVYLREYIYNPQLLVIERPFLETDIRIRMHIISLIAKFKARGAAVLIIDSSMTGSDAFSDRMLIVGTGGRITGERKFGGMEE
jgi:ribose transport system ATP-binding protein